MTTGQLKHTKFESDRIKNEIDIRNAADEKKIKIITRIKPVGEH